MKKIVQVIVLSVAVMSPAFAQQNQNQNQNQNGQGQNGQGQNYAAPGPIAGAGLPILLAGYGVYWLIKRRRRTDV
jgi:hypothetical protein